ncbi:hypothetical protein [Streptomyces tropicalis]|uniref:Uncharacterized protein n=1 Tax=Streptomyces tropicalis TaxID=3034234 RepID=A0ABT6A0T0_9ACTN|nr:hypothetical protein [Streptomyces tropicalis]MDF3298256.1 hypothetical protein [Streptomyces tropicalis]
MTAIQHFWRHPPAGQVREEGREQGRVEDRREMVLRILEWRGIPMPGAGRERVEACADPGRPEVWAQRAVQAADAADPFAGE